MLYACYGLLLIPISYLSSKWVWCIIALLAIQPVELFCLLTGYTYYGKARNAYGYLVKMKKKGGKLVKATIEQMLSCLHRDILTLIDLTAGEFRYRLDCLRKDQCRVLDATMKMYFQQEQMFLTGEHSCKDRIISI